MKIRVLFLCSCALFLTSCDSLHYKQYVIRDASFEDRETVSAVLANVARVATLEEVTVESSVPKILAYYEEKPEIQSSFKVWLGARMLNEDLIIDLSCFYPGWNPPPVYKSAETDLFQELSKMFGERLIINPQPKIPFSETPKPNME